MGGYNLYITSHSFHKLTHTRKPMALNQVLHKYSRQHTYSLWRNTSSRTSNLSQLGRGTHVTLSSNLGATGRFRQKFTNRNEMMRMKCVSSNTSPAKSNTPELHPLQAVPRVNPTLYDHPTIPGHDYITVVWSPKADLNIISCFQKNFYY